MFKQEELRIFSEKMSAKCTWYLEPCPIQVLPNCQVSEKLDERARSYFRTHGRDSLGLQQLRRETKKSDNSGEPI